MEKVSVIIPAYNVERFISECVESVMGQTYENIEIIVVDDGSSDRTLDICKELSEKDERIKLVNGGHGGVSRARNAALDHATGDYIMSVDSDDTISPKMFESLFKNLSENSADIAVCDYEMVYADRRVSVNPRGISMKFSAEESIKNVLLSYDTSTK